MLKRILLPRTRGFHIWSGGIRSGHNKWSTIKHDKAKNDAARNRINTKFANQIALAVKLGGGSVDPGMNLRLATAIELASRNNVPKKVVEGALKRASGAAGSGSEAPTELCVYEGLGPGNVAFVIEALTDNKNRTVGLVRSVFTKLNCSLTPTLYFFDRHGQISVTPPENMSEDAVLETVFDIDGIEDVTENSGKYQIFTDPQATNKIATELRDRNFQLDDITIAFRAKPDSQSTIENEETRKKLRKLIQNLEDIDEITAYYHNLADDQDL